MTSEKARPGEFALGPASWVEEHGDALYRIAIEGLGRRDLAEDAVQETFLAAVAALGRFEGRSSPRTWLVAILRRKIIDSRRSADLRGRLVDLDGVVGPFFDAKGGWTRPPSSWNIEGEELRLALDGCLDRLPRHLAEPFVLRECEEVDADEVRRALDLSAGNLRIRLHRARLLLRECLEKHGFGKDE